MHPAYRPDIDGLRALAILLVIATHAYPEWLSGGYVGVDLFFVISGYLISGIVLGGLAEGSFSFARFYVRRARRLLPALAIVLAACYAIGWRELLPLEFRQLCRGIAAAAGFVANIVFMQDASYFDVETVRKPLIHLWSLGVEEQFYAVWPLCLWFAWRRRRHAMTAVVLVMATIFALSFASSVSETGVDRVTAFYSPVTRFWELLAGALLVPLASYCRVAGRRADLLALLGTLLIGGSALVFDGSTSFPGIAALIPVAGSCLLIVSGPSGAWLNRRVLGHRAAVFVGLISYPLYLWHWPLLSFAQIVSPDAPSPAERAMLLATSFLLAWLTYRFVEQPIRTRGKGGLEAAVLGVTMLALGVVGWATFSLGGIPSRYAERTRALATYAYDYRAGARYGTCWLDENAPSDGFAPECIGRSNSSGEQAPRTILLWGDSHAGRLYPGLRQAAPRDVDILELARSSCVPILDVNGIRCERDNDFVFEQIRRIKPQTLLLFAAWAEYWTPPHGRDIWQLFEETLDRAKAAGVGKIVVVGPAPRWNEALPRLLVSFLEAHPDQERPPEHMTFGLSDVARQSDRRLRAIAERHGAVFVSLVDLMCNDGGCLTRVPDGSRDDLTTWDRGHFTQAAGAWVSNKLFDANVLP